MDLAWISVAALAITVVTSCFTRINPGVLAITLAWLIAAGIGPLLGEPIPLKVVLAGFPAELFLTLSGVTLLFSQAQVNGTLDLVARGAVRCCRGHPGLIPLAFFVLTAALSAIGAGSIATTALIAPMAMAAAASARVPAFLMVLMVGHGAIAGGMSPFSLTGVVANGLMDRVGLPGHAWRICAHNLCANLAVALLGYAFLGGWRLWKHGPDVAAARERPGTIGTEHHTAGHHTAGAPSTVPVPDARDAPPWDRRHGLTLLAILGLIVAVVVGEAPVGMAAYAGVAFLTLARAADERETFHRVPWSVLLMVCGVSMLTALIERTGGIDRITDVIASVSTPRSAAGILAFATGAISVYSSTSGVVLPAFLPAVPSLVNKLGGGDPLDLASSIVIGSNLVDVSPLSTIGALCVACASAGEDRRLLFHQVLAWGLSMAIVGAAFCTLVFAPR